jgi:heme/copper-type cytochrome/quinol oxidase subunit 2
MPDFESVGSALLITVGMLAVSVTVVGLAMWFVYKFFKNKDEE